MNLQFYQILQNKTWLIRIRKETKARHVSFVRDKEQYFLDVRFDNNIGGVDKFTYKLDGAPEELRPYDFEQLIQALNNRENE